MKDPIGSFEIIKENFIRYVETAFGTRYSGVEKERYALLNYDKVFYRKPWIEPLPDYLSSNKKIGDLTIDDVGNSLSGSELTTFKELVTKGLFPAAGKLHAHQAKMLKEALKGNNCIITSGTGSGKTESFLLPLFAQLSKEFTNWNAPHAKSTSLNNWWKERHEGGLTPTQVVNASDFSLSNNVRQRQHEVRPSGVRALILYPMNALVEDQMSRLRKALDSDDTREWLAENANGNNIFFGRYNGSSPVAGELMKTKQDGSQTINTKKVNKLINELRQIDKDSERVAQYIQTNSIQRDKAKDLKSFFQRLDGAEMRCRFDMQLSPPDILITNYSMLSIMLMRAVDSGIFDKTKDWLNCEDLPEASREAAKKDRIFHLIIDELHLYRGTQGTEVAYLLKLVLNRLGLHPHHSQLRILASSASLEAEDTKSRKFLEDFFGVSDSVKPFKIIEGENNPITELNNGDIKLPTQPFSEIADAFDRAKENVEDVNFIEVCEKSAESIASFLGIQIEDGNGIEKLLKSIIHPNLKLKERLYAPCKTIDSKGGISYKAVCSVKGIGDFNESNYFAEAIFASDDSKELQNALRGLLIARALLDEPNFELINKGISEERKLPRFRFHYFFRNIEGIWASVKKEDIDNPEFYDSDRTAGKLYATTRISSENGNRVLELLYCDNCGTTLFGGSRLVTRRESGAHSFEMLPISPNIEGIPEKTPAKLVEKRSFQEYAVFWPCGENELTMHDADHGIPANFWRQVSVNGFDQSDYEANWVEASLNCISGDIDFRHEKANTDSSRWIKGYYFTIVPNSSSRDISLPNAAGEINTTETHRALPCVCPSCGINHQKKQNSHKKSKTTPIRGFRTGFAKTTQMFAKELMYQLPDTESERKLVVFSDSREDAAQIANGIERNHFTDLLREILVTELHSNVMTRYKIINAFDRNDTTTKGAFNISHKELYDEIEDLYDKSLYSGSNAVKEKEKRESSDKLNQYRSLIVKVRDLVTLTDSINLAPLIKRFVKLGINGGGNDIRIQSRLLNNQFVPWYELIDFTNLQWVEGADQTFIDDLKEGTYKHLASMFFGSLFYSFESSALGYVTVNPKLDVLSDTANSLGIATNTFIEVINSTIRILGDKYKHNKNEDADAFTFTDYARFPEQVKKYVKALVSSLHVNENTLGSAIYNVLSSTRLLNVAHGIVIEELSVKISIGQDPVWISQRGSRPHLHFSGGVCTYSMTRLNVQYDKICDDIWKKNYLSYNAIKEQREPIRLHCEELTGQTDDQFERQRHFRNIILPDEGNEKVKAIDLLSVTTTLEVGVDIGALQAVMLGNMPPQRFNYQQRVGRAGRRGQAYSVILTFCRGRSHDEFYFSNPHKITGDAPPTPFLTMGQARIFKRLLAKEVLRNAYLNIAINVNNDEEKSSVHGEFGNVGDLQANWLSYKTQIINWITNNSQEIEAIVDALITPDLRDEKAELIAWCCDVTSSNGLIGKSQSLIDNEEIATNDISEKLAEGGILPMFGMPTTVKNLYHGINKHLEPLTIDRPQSMAIYEFAIGAQKTKDKAIHSVVGFTSDIITTRIGANEVVTNARTNNNLPFSLNRWMIRCRSCGFFETYSESNKTTLEAANHFDTCPNCGEPNLDKYQKPIMLKAPRAYRTNFSLGSDLKDDSEILLSRPPIFAEKVEDPSNPDKTNLVSNANLIISDKDVTWRVNTNSDQFFNGRIADVRNTFPFPASYSFNQQWIAQSVIDELQANPFNENGYSIRVFPEGAEEQIVLASNKKTEIFRISPSSVPLELDLNMFSREYDAPFVKAQANGVRSAYYSAAFLLQRILANKLDIDPTEIEIADISMKQLNDGTKIAEIILTDELPNGSGFVRYLFDNFQDILNEALSPAEATSYVGKIYNESHKHTCKDACYECLKVYRNMSYHSLLDWRLGLSMLRILNDPDYKCGTDNNFNSIELQGWIEHATALRNSFAESFGYSHLSDINGLPIIKWGARQKNLIVIVHPFWNMQNMMEDNWLTEIQSEIEDYKTNHGGTVSIIDTFNLHRRLGWCYEKLIVRQ